MQPSGNYTQFTQGQAYQQPVSQGQHPQQPIQQPVQQPLQQPLQQQSQQVPSTPQRMASDQHAKIKRTVSGGSQHQATQPQATQPQPLQQQMQQLPPQSVQQQQVTVTKTTSVHQQSIPAIQQVSHSICFLLHFENGLVCPQN